MFIMVFVIRSRLFMLLVLVMMFIPFYIVLSRLQGESGEKNVGSKDWFQKAEIENVRRKRHVTEVCQFLKINRTIADIPPSYLDHFIVDDIHKLIYCSVPKVACTNWKRVLISLQNLGTKDPLSISGDETHHSNAFKTLDQFSSQDIEDKLNSYSKFLFVRHPYERLLSAFRNKLEESYGDYFRVRFGTDIIKTFRHSPSKESIEKGHDVKFEEYIQYITTLNVKDWKRAFNEHWRPIFDLCFPCHLKYDFVGKYETLETDAAYILQNSSYSQFIKFPDRQQSYKKQRTADVMQTYYRNISINLHRKLFEIYKEDFTLFEYETFY